jgi:hypothetical protein
MFFYLVTFIDTCRKSSELFWSVTVSTTEARHNHGALQSCNRPVTAHCDLATVQSAVRASRRTWICGCQYSVQIIIVKSCVSVSRSVNRPVLLVQWVRSIRIQLNPSVGKCTVWVKRHQLNCPSQLLWTDEERLPEQNKERIAEWSCASCRCFLCWRDHAGFDEKEIVHQVVFRPSFRSMIDLNPQE